MDIPIERRIDVLVEAGIPHRIEKERFSPVVHVFMTSGGTEEGSKRSQLVWSMLREKCLITKCLGHGSSWNDLETRAPTSYFYRLLHDDGGRMGFSRWGLFIAMTFLLVPLLLVAFPGISSFWNFLAFVFSLLLVWVGLWVWFRSQIVFSAVVAPKRLLGRFLLGAIFGGVWLLASGVAFSPIYVSGAFWVFTVSNVVWMLTVDHDRWLFMQQVEKVGGLLPYEEATSQLQSMTEKV